jgi:hypothetical protein
VRGSQLAEHGYNRYSNGCRCETCRAAKAAYIGERRRAATARAAPGRVVPGIKHGTRRGYKELGCRCEPCTAEMRAVWLRWERSRRKTEAAA